MGWGGGHLRAGQVIMGWEAPEGWTGHHGVGWGAPEGCGQGHQVLLIPMQQRVQQVKVALHRGGAEAGLGLGQGCEPTRGQGQG